MSTTIPPGLTIAPPPPELRLGDDDPWNRWRIDQSRDDDDYRHDPMAEATAFPERIETDTLDTLQAKLFACSGAADSTRYQEATWFRAMPDMTWPEARAALNRLAVGLQSYGRLARGKPAARIALADFALTAHGFEGFVGLRGEHGVKLRQEICDAIRTLHHHLAHTLNRADRDAAAITRPITNRLHGEEWHGNKALWAMVPVATDRWARIIEATPDHMIAALDHLRATLATWNARRSVAERVAACMLQPGNMPTAAEYAEALHIAEMLAFVSTKLLMLYAGIMHSMPVYRLYPATSEREAIELWWPWGRAKPLVDGGPARASAPRKKVLDPGIITAKRPQDVVSEVIERTGINRTTAQRMTAGLRADMRRKRHMLAVTMLRRGVTRAAVARSVGLSPSRISAMFKGQTFPTKNALADAQRLDDDPDDEDGSDDA